MKAIFHSFRKEGKAYPEFIEGCKTALVIVKDNMYCLGGKPVFVSASACRDQGHKQGDLIELGDNIVISDMLDQDGNPMKHTSGQTFQVLKGA